MRTPVQPRARVRRAGRALWCLGAAALAAGCASAPERAAFDELGRVGREAGYSRAERELPALTENAGLGDCLLYAERNNPGLEAAFNRWRAALERVPQARTLPDPMLSLMLEGQSTVNMRSLMLSQTFPWWGKLDLAGQAALDAAQAEFGRYESARLALFFRVKDAYSEYYYLARAIAITEESLALLRNLESVLRERYRAADASYPDLIRLQVELGKLEDELTTTQTMREPISARLNAALNRPAAAPVPWPKALKQPPMTATDDQLLDLLFRENPELKAMAANVAEQDKRIDLARKAYYPDPTLGAGFTQRNRKMLMGMDTWTASIGINLPIWWGKLSAGVREARASRAAAAQSRTDHANALASDLKMAAWRFHDAERKISLYRDTLIPKAIQAFKATQVAFQAGKATFADFIDTQRTLLEFQLSYERALANRAQRLAELEMLVGKPVTAAE